MNLSVCVGNSKELYIDVKSGFNASLKRLQIQIKIRFGLTKNVFDSDLVWWNTCLRLKIRVVWGDLNLKYVLIELKMSYQIV